MPATAIRAVIFGLALAGAGACTSASAEMLRFKADLLPVAGTGSTASGSLNADYDTDSKKLTWSGSYKGVGTYATSASFHGAPAGPRRAFVRILNFDSPFEGTAILSAPQGEGLLAGEWSLVIRTAGFPKGELRGQLVRN
ncbi:MAG: CHRD domain-containing protein [Hyphomicrobium sp.]|uniref:CHRD domain-containing protein n=1 Tax=Hyphomicrobium sp. TaxID=82 RepID=UPI00132896A3|nr:CHRD domain-containing protein [Hyphomicrobium sp.]KAB2939925.1 MAG: CHRD domain-containing protein [Hyphomicrobium sp.]MBZ0209854.1 CHRD domain-containing protein [Hyphomicrobium sp.]